MRYLRMLTNAVAGGILAASYLAVLLLQINPQVPLTSPTAVRWFATLVAFYGLHLSVVVYLLILVREVLASRRLQPGWLSVRILAWLGAASAATAALITWGNLEGFRAVLGEPAAARIQSGAIATTLCAGVLVVVAVLRYSFGRQGSRATAALLVVTLLLSIAVPLWIRGPGDLTVPAVRSGAPRLAGSPGTARVRLLLLDGASLEYIRERVAAGHLPNFGRILDRGAVMDLATLKPTQAEPVWTAAATGKYPPLNGVRSNAVYFVGGDDPDPVDLLPDLCFAYALVYQRFVTEGPATAASLRARPLWDILGDFGIASGIVRWPLTYPARIARGYMISDQFHLGSSSPLRAADASAGYPTTAAELARQAFDLSQSAPWPEVLPATGSTEATPDGLPLARWDRVYSEAAALVEPQFSPQFTAVRYQGIDAVSHLVWEDAAPGRQARPGRDRRALLDRYYTYVDGEVRRSLARLAPGDLLLVASGFGMARVSVPKRLLARLLRQPDFSGTHEPAPDGFLLAAGTNVAAGPVPRGAIVDLAPTVLYYLGVPIGRDMDGYARADLLLKSYAREHPITYISTHQR